MQFDSSFNIRFVNCRGLGLLSSNSKRHRLNRISHKIKELEYSNNGIPSLYALLETKLKPSKNTPNLPNNCSYIGETSGGKGGILLYSHNSLETENFKVISSKHACYIRLKIKEKYIENIIVYLPCDILECFTVLSEIEKFIVNNNISNFCIYGDFNISFDSPHHSCKAKRLQKFLSKFNLFDLADKLGSNHAYTWSTIRNKKLHTSNIDHFFVNFDGFTSIRFEHNSFSDHMHATVSFKKPYVYTSPKWKNYLFRNKDFTSMLEKKATEFLFDYADPGILLKSKEFYVENPTCLDNEMSFNSLEYKDTTAFFKLLKHLKNEHDRFFSKYKLKNFHKTQEFNKQVNMLYENLSRFNSRDTLNQIQNLVKTQQDYFKGLVFTQAEFRYMQRLKVDGANNSYTFKHIPNLKKQNYKLKIDGNTVTCPHKLANIFAENHAKIVSPENIPPSELKGLLEDYDLTLDEIFPQIKSLTSPYSTSIEFKNIIKSMKNCSAPGITSETKILFEFLINIFPNFITRALNNLYNIDIDQSPFKFIKDRNIIFIAKKNSDLLSPDDYRGIALLETVYKILSKALNKKLNVHLHKIIHSQQFGFVPNRTMSNASINITAAINHIVKKKDNAQIIALDWSRAFDTILPSVIDSILLHIFPNGSFAKTFNQLTNNGRFRVAIKGTFSKFYKLKRGSAQGDPPSGSKFIITNHIFIRCLISEKLKHIFYKIGKKHTKPKSFADDSILISQLKTNKDVNDLKQLLHKLEKGIGLHINFSKTKILTHGTFPPDLASIGKIVDKLKHLGIYLSFNQNLARIHTYDELCSKLEKKAKSIPLKSSYNLIKRRNLCSHLLSACAYHVYRIYPPDEKYCKSIWKIISKFLWSSRNPDGKISYRYKISQNRIEQDFTQGGLNFLKPDTQAFSIWLNSFMNCLRFSSQHNDTTISLILEHKHLNIQAMLPTFSYKTIIEHQNFFKSLYPCAGGNYFHKLSEFFYDLEHEPSTFFQSPIISSNFANISTPFNKHDENILLKTKKLTIASIFETRKIDEKVLFLPCIKSDLSNIIRDVSLINKLSKLVESTKTAFPRDCVFSMKRAKQLLIPIGTVFLKNKSVFSLHFKLIHRNKNSCELPALKTRVSDKLYIPDKEMLSMSLKKIFSMPIILYYKNFILEQMNRTLNSKNKLYKFKLTDSNLCSKCNIISSTEHALYFCVFPTYFIHKLALFLDYVLNDSKPEFIFLKENFYLYNMFYEGFSNDFYLQLSHLILVAKDRSLKISIEDDFIKWDDNNFYAHSILLSQFTCKLLHNAGLNNNIIYDFINFISN